MEVQEQCLNWKKPSSSKRNFQLTLPVFLGLFFNWGSINLYFMWTSHIPVCSSRALFFHSESLLRHTLEEAGYNEKKEKGKKKYIPGWQWQNTHCGQVSRAGHPGTMENPHQSQQLPGLCSIVTKRSSISWQSPTSHLLSQVQSGLSSFSYHHNISLCCARHLGLCTVFVQGSVKKYFTKRITLSWIWFESFPSKTSCKGILKLTLKLKDNKKKDYLSWQKRTKFLIYDTLSGSGRTMACESLQAHSHRAQNCLGYTENPFLGGQPWC